MKGRICLATCAAFVFATTMSVLAQDPARQQTSPAAGAAKTIIVTGCVKRAEAGTAGTTGTTTPPSAAEPKFVLSDAAVKPSETAATTGTTAPAATASEYRLDSDEAKLTEHVGHKVEITGTPEQPSGMEQKPPASGANAPTLKVVSVKMLATTCQ